MKNERSERGEQSEQLIPKPRLCSFKTCPLWSDNLERTDEPGTGGTGGGKDDDDDDGKKDKDRA